MTSETSLDAFLHLRRTHKISAQDKEVALYARSQGDRGVTMKDVELSTSVGYSGTHRCLADLEWRGVMRLTDQTRTNPSTGRKGQVWVFVTPEEDRKFWRAVGQYRQVRDRLLRDAEALGECAHCHVNLPEYYGQNIEELVAQRGFADPRKALT